jgi:hypothetical protein
VSTMPQGLFETLTEKEVVDLVTYIRKVKWVGWWGGRPVYKKAVFTFLPHNFFILVNETPYRAALSDGPIPFFLATRVFKNWQ